MALAKQKVYYQVCLTIKSVVVPELYFFDFLRGLFDGDGYSHSYFDPRWKSSFMFYIGFVSASSEYIKWLRLKIFKLSGLSGHVTKSKKKNYCYQLKFSKYEAIKLCEYLYKDGGCVKLTRKYLKIMESLAIVHMQRQNIDKSMLGWRN